METGVLDYHVAYSTVKTLQWKIKTKQMCISTQLKTSTILAETGNIC